MNEKMGTLKKRNPVNKIPGAESGIDIKKTICSICNPMSHCGIDAYVKDGRVIKVEGTRENPHSRGTLCAKGAANRQYIYHPDRIGTPLKRTGARGSGKFESISWEAALDEIAERLLKIKDETGPESVAFFVGFSKWMRPFVKRLAHSYGSPNYCTESSTCATAVKIASVLNYGAFYLPDLQHAKCLLVWSTNPFYSNTSTIRRLLAARERGMRIIEVGPLLTPLTAHADIHLRLRPGTSGALALGMARIIIEEGLFSHDFVHRWSLGFDEYRQYVSDYTPEKVEAITRVPAALLVKAARLYATTKPAALISGMSPTVHHTNGLQNHRAIAALIGLTGNFDEKGGNYCLPPGWLNQPSGVLTRSAEFEQSRPYAEMAPRIGQDKYPVWCELEAQAQAMELPFQIESAQPYPIKAMIGFGFNHRMWPASDFMAEKIQKLDFLVQVELFMTDTARMSDIILPACSSFERSELKIYPYPTRYAIWTQPAIDPLGQARSDVDVICDLARRIAPDDQLLGAGHETCLDWILEPSGLSIAELSKYPAGKSLDTIFYPPYRKYKKNGFHTPSGKMEFASGRLREAGLDALPTYREPKYSPVSTPKMFKDYPLILTTGARLPLTIHSRTYRLPWIKRLRPDHLVDMNPKDARERDIGQGDPVYIATQRSRIPARANLTEVVAPGVVNVAHGNPAADVNLLIEPDYLDPVSGFPGFKSLLCEVKKG
jgi:anaerobic selenocysteine-containing dehydrogenase